MSVHIMNVNYEKYMQAGSSPKSGTLFKIKLSGTISKLWVIYFCSLGEKKVYRGVSNLSMAAAGGSGQSYSIRDQQLQC